MLRKNIFKNNNENKEVDKIANIKNSSYHSNIKDINTQINIDYTLTSSLDKNIQIFKEYYKDDNTLIIRQFKNKYLDDVSFAVVCFDGMCNDKQIADEIIKPIINSTTLSSSIDLYNQILNEVIISAELEEISFIKTENTAFLKPFTPNYKKKTFCDILENLLYGDTLLMIDGYSKGLILSTKGWDKRSIEEPQNETVLKGPKEGFTESILQNISLIRKKLPTPSLKVEHSKLGKLTNSKIAIIYIDNVVNKIALTELKKRVSKINIDGILDSNYISELIGDKSFSTFKTVGATERPDTVVGKILEGRIAILVDGSPCVLTVPYLFIEYFQTSDDYYLNYFYATFSRIIRILSFIIAISIPAIYLSLITFHQKMVPLNLLLSIATSKQGVPFPTLLEIIFFLGMFEILREASIHMPPHINQALGIVGGLVVGQAAVEAKLISAPIVIIVALSGITGIMTNNLKSSIMLFRIYLLILSSFIGLYGYVFGMCFLALELLSMKSFNVDYLTPISSIKINENKDLLLRLPWQTMLSRPQKLTDNIIRQIDNNINDINSNNEISDSKYKKTSLKSSFKNSSKKYFTLIVILLLPLFLTGCWNYSEITNESIILGCAIDKTEDDMIKLTMEVVSFNEDVKSNSSANSSNSSEDNSSDQETEIKGENLNSTTSSNNAISSPAGRNTGNSVIIESVGPSIYEAISNSTRIMGSKPYFNHTKAFILSNKINHEDFTRVIDCLARNATTNINTQILISKLDTASEILKADVLFSDYLFFNIASNLETALDETKAIDSKLYKLVSLFENSSTSFILPSITLKSQGDKKVAVIDGSSIFFKDKIAGYLNDTETTFVSILRGEARSGILSFNAETLLEENPNISMQFYSIKTNLTPLISKNNLKCSFDIDLKLELIGVVGLDHLFKDDYLFKLSSIIDKYLEEKLTTFLEIKKQELKFDFLNLKNNFKIKNSKEFYKLEPNWNQVFENMDFEINVHSHILSTGSLINNTSEVK